MSKFRRIAWMKWPRPIPYPSPSPPVTMTFSSGFASLAPYATGSARPWIAWNPYVDRKCGRLLEQPMPETTRMFHGSSWSVWTAVWRARNTAKSPHPGHQVGLISDLYVSISKAACMRPTRGSCPRCPATRTARRRTGRRSGPACSRSPPEGVARTGRCSCPRPRGIASRRGAVSAPRPRGTGRSSGTPSYSPSCLPSPRPARSPRARPPRGPPADQGEVRVPRAPHLGGRRIFAEPIQLAHPLLVHLAPLFDELGEAREDVGDELAALHVLVRRPDELVALRPRERPRTDAALRDLVAFEVLRGAAVRGHHPADDRDIEVELVDRPVPLAQIQVRDHDDGRLVDLRQVERLRGEGETFLRMPRGQGRRGPGPWACAGGQVEVALLRLGRDPVGGPAAF